MVVRWVCECVGGQVSEVKVLSGELEGVFAQCLCVWLV